MDNFRNDLKYPSGTSANMQELTTGIRKIMITPSTTSSNVENITVTPDIYFNFKAPAGFDPCDTTKFKYYTTNLASDGKLYGSEMETKKIKEEKMELPITDMIVEKLQNQISSISLISCVKSRNITKIQDINNYKSVHDSAPQIMKEKKSMHSFINVYCSKCEIASRKSFDKKCLECQAVLLFQCTNCTRLYKTLTGIESHLKYECYAESEYYCSFCFYKSPRKSQLIQHIRNEHSEPLQSSSLQCSTCNRNFKTQSNLMIHEKKCVLGPNLQCKYCFFKTKFDAGLKRHIQVKHSEHFPQNSHKCPNCETKFTSLKNLNRHIQRICGQRKNARFRCEHCNYEINRKYMLVKHIQLSHPNLFSSKLLSNL